MSEDRDVKTSDRVDPATAVIPAAPGPRQAGATAVTEPRAPGVAAGQVPAQGAQGAPPAPPAPPSVPAGDAPSPVPPAGDRTVPAEPAARSDVPGGHATAPVTVRPRPRVPSREQMMRMGPWAPVAGAAVGLVLGIVVVALLAPAVSVFAERLSLVFVVLGMTLLGAGGTLLADEVRLLRRGTQAIEARSSSAGVIAGLLNGLTPARLLLLVSAFVLLLSAYVTTSV